MPTLTMTLPILPGKTEAWQRFCQELSGERREAHEASRRRLGITQERFALVQTRLGTAVLVSIQARDVGWALSRLAASEHAFDRWYREKFREMHGFWLGGDASEPAASSVAAPRFTWSAGK